MVTRVALSLALVLTALIAVGENLYIQFDRFSDAYEQQ